MEIPKVKLEKLPNLKLMDKFKDYLTHPRIMLEPPYLNESPCMVFDNGLQNRILSRASSAKGYLELQWDYQLGWSLERENPLISSFLFDNDYPEFDIVNYNSFKNQLLAMSDKAIISYDDKGSVIGHKLHGEAQLRASLHIGSITIPDNGFTKGILSAVGEYKGVLKRKGYETSSLECLLDIEIIVKDRASNVKSRRTINLLEEGDVSANKENGKEYCRYPESGDKSIRKERGVELSFVAGDKIEVYAIAYAEVLGDTPEYSGYPVLNSMETYVNFSKLESEVANGGFYIPLVKLVFGN